MSRALRERGAGVVATALFLCAPSACATNDDSSGADAEVGSSSGGSPSTEGLSSSGASGTAGPDASTASQGEVGPATTNQPSTTGPDTGDSTDSGPGSSEGSGTGETIPDGLVPAFVAQGHMGRTMISCDDGETWVANRSLDDSIRCFEGLDCDHHEGSGTGLTYGDGVFVATWGWGTEGEVQVSSDGVTWTAVLTGPTFSGTAYGNDTFIAGAKVPYSAGPLGDAWTELADSGLDEWTPRGIGFAPTDGGRFILGGGGGGSGDVVVSADQGETWTHPSGASPGCGGSISGIAGSGDAIVIAAGEGSGTQLCVSTDAGGSFVDVPLPESLRGTVMWTGGDFVGFGASARHTSADGLDWTSTPYASGDPSPTALARSAAGTYVAQRDGWLVWYEQQTLFRSEDGLNWTALPAGAFVGSHPLRHIRFGYVEPSDQGCEP